MPLLFDNSLHYPKNADKNAFRFSSIFDFPLRYRAFYRQFIKERRKQLKTGAFLRFDNSLRCIFVIRHFVTVFSKLLVLLDFSWVSDLRQIVTVKVHYSTFHYGFSKSAENKEFSASDIRIEQLFQKRQYFLFDISLRLFDISLRLFDIPLQGLDFSLRLFDIPLRGSFL